MPVDADPATLGWKPGVPTIGVNGITARGSGVDQYMAWSVPAYARLYRYTNDEHYLDVARILLHNTKAMLAIPGRTYDLLGPGWQQENWSMGRNRGNGYFRNPVLTGTRADNSIVRVDKDYYMVAGGRSVWHSRDMVNWVPLTPALNTFRGGTWASDISYCNGKYYVYSTEVNMSRDTH